LAFGEYTEGLVPTNLDDDIKAWLRDETLAFNYAGTVYDVKLSEFYGQFSDRMLQPIGGASPADLEANKKGMTFWDSLMNTPVNDIRAGTFNICDYVTPGWNESENKNVPGAWFGFWQTQRTIMGKTVGGNPIPQFLYD